MQNIVYFLGSFRKKVMDIIYQYFIDKIGSFQMDDNTVKVSMEHTLHLPYFE